MWKDMQKWKERWSRGQMDVFYCVEGWTLNHICFHSPCHITSLSLFHCENVQQSTSLHLQTPLIVCVVLSMSFIIFLSPWLPFSAPIPSISPFTSLSLHFTVHRHGVFSPGMNVPSPFSQCSSPLTPLTPQVPIRMKYWTRRAPSRHLAAPHSVPSPAEMKDKNVMLCLHQDLQKP